MTPDEVIEKLKQLNIKITRRTLLNYEKWGFIEKAVRGGKGRGRGRSTEYSEKVWLHAYAAYRLMHDNKIPPKHITAAINESTSEQAIFEHIEQTIIDTGLLLFGYLNAGACHVPYGGRVILFREKDIKEKYREIIWEAVKNNKSIADLGTKKYDTLVIIMDDKELADKGLSSTFVIMWNDEVKKWEYQDFKKC